MACSFWETVCQPNPCRFRPHSLPWMLNALVIALSPNLAAAAASLRCGGEGGKGGSRRSGPAAQGRARRRSLSKRASAVSTL